MKNCFTFLLLISFSFVQAQIDLIQFNQEFKQKPKPIFLYFNTDWCSVCKIQEKIIEKNNDINTILENEYYFIKLNGESKEEITFLNKVFLPNPQIKTHSLVTEFIPSQDVAFPLWIILDKNLEVLGKFSGLIKKKNFQLLFQQIKKE